MLLKHSSGLKLLFATEMWERFGFYMLRSLLVLYMTARLVDGGLGWDKGSAIELYSWYMTAAYLTPILGGYIADRFLGQRRSTMIGAILMTIGYFCMGFNHLPFFFSALALVALGNGFFKPCLTSILGELYNDASESQRDSAYSIFYMGINIGGAVAGIAAGIFMDYYGFDAGFMVAGIGMSIALAIFWWGKDKFLGDAGVKPQVDLSAHEKEPLTASEKQRVWIIFVLFFLTIFFVAAWEQMGGLIPLFIHEGIDRTLGSWTIPTPWIANVDPLLIVFLAPILSWLWLYLDSKGKDPFLGQKLGIGFFLMGAAFLLITWVSGWVDQGLRPSWGWIALYKFIVVVGELAFFPISWAAVTRLSPPRYTTRFMGLMLAGIGFGALAAGQIGKLVDAVGTTAIFNGLTIGLFAFGILCFALNKKMEETSEVRA